MDGFFHGFVVPGAEKPGDDDTGTHGHTVEKAHQHEDQTGGGAYCRQGGVADVAAHHPGVEGVIKLLKKVAQEDRQGKQQHLFPDRTLRQGVGIRTHEKHFLFKKLHTQQ